MKQKIAIHTIRIVSNDPTDHATCDEHFKRIAQGRDYPTPPHTFDGKATPDFIAELVGFLSKATVGLVEAKSGKPIPKDTPALGLLLDMVGSATEAATGRPRSPAASQARSTARATSNSSHTCSSSTGRWNCSARR